MGAFLAIPLLFSLMGLGALIYATSLAMVVAEQDEVDAVTLESIAEAEKARFTARELQDLRREIEELRNELRVYSDAQQRQALFEALAKDLEKVRSQLGAAEARLSRRRDAKAETTEELDALRKLREQAAEF